METAHISDMIQVLDAADTGQKRIVLAVAGAPGSGKSTLADALCNALNQRKPGYAEVFPMDGYHLDNAILDARGWRERKGAAHTFDVDAFAQDLRRVREATRSVFVPVFDRGLDLARASAREITPECRVVIVEGNYLLLTQDPWLGVADCYDMTVFLDVPEPVLQARLIQRWRDHGLSDTQARARAMGNDIPNARVVVAESRKADLVVVTG